MLIVADDFGANAAATDAILLCLSRKAIHLTSALANGSHLETGVSRARAEGQGARIGLHFNLTEGRPLTPGIASCARFCHEGLFYQWRTARPLLRLGRYERSSVLDECAAQLYQLRKVGASATFLDGHHHVHTEPGIAQLLVREAPALGLTAIRIGRNIGPSRNFVNRRYKALLNRSLEKHGLARTRYFGDIRDVSTLTRAQQDVAELMVHPTFSSNGTVVDALDPQVPLLEALARINRTAGPFDEI